jgi:hypothetical protein
LSNHLHPPTEGTCHAKPPQHNPCQRRFVCHKKDSPAASYGLNESFYRVFRWIYQTKFDNIKPFQTATYLSFDRRVISPLYKMEDTGSES